MKHSSIAPYSFAILDYDTSLLKTVAANRPGLNIFYGEEQSERKLTDIDLKPVTKTIQKLRKHKRKYVNTPNKVRLELIDAVNKHGEKIKDAAKRLGINYSSAKAICQVYKKEGRSDKLIVKKRKSKPEASVKQEKLIFAKRDDNELQGKIANREKTSFIKFEENTFSSPESLNISCKEEEEAYTTSDRESENVLRRTFSPSSFCQVNQNNAFVTVHPNYSPATQKMNAMHIKQFLSTNFQSNYTQAPYLTNQFALPDVQSHQDLVSRMVNPSMPQLNLGFPSQIPDFHPQYHLSMNLARQMMMVPDQSQLNHNGNYHALGNLGMNPNILKLKQMEASQSLDTIAPMLNGYIYGTDYDQMAYYSKL